MSRMFKNAIRFDQTLENWEVGDVINIVVCLRMHSDSTSH